MIAMDKGALPKEITQENVTAHIGESVFWYCHQCEEWHTTEIAPGGVITCPRCDQHPKWKKGTVFVSLSDRLRIVKDLCSDGSSLQQEVEDAEQRYADYIDATWRGMSKRERETGRRSFQRVWKTLDELTDYIVAAKDMPEDDIPHAFSEDGLKQLDFDPARVIEDNNGDGDNELSKQKSYKCVNYLSDMKLRREDYDPDTSDFEIIEVIAINKGLMQPSPSAEERFFQQEMFNSITDPVERSIALDFARGLVWKKTDIGRNYGLTASEVRTKIKHIRTSLARSGYLT